MNLTSISHSKLAAISLISLLLIACGSDDYDHMGCTWNIPSEFKQLGTASKGGLVEFVRFNYHGNHESEGILFAPKKSEKYSDNFTLLREIESCGYTILEMKLSGFSGEIETEQSVVAITRAQQVVTFVNTDYEEPFNSCLKSIEHSC